MLLAVLSQAELPQTFLCLSPQLTFKDLTLQSLAIMSISNSFPLLSRFKCVLVITLRCWKSKCPAISCQNYLYSEQLFEPFMGEMSQIVTDQ